MNKKFFTLLASTLLAGGLFSTANAEKLAEAQAGYYYKVVRNLTYDVKSQKWTAAKAPLYALDAVDKDFMITANSDDVWTVTGDATKGYTLKSLNGKTFTFAGSNKVKAGDHGSVTVSSTVIYGEQLQMMNNIWVSAGSVSNGAASLVEGATYGAKCVGSAFTLVETPLAYVKNAADVELSNGLVAYIYTNGKKVNDTKYVISYNANTKAFSLKTLADGKVVNISGCEKFVVAKTLGKSYLFSVDGLEGSYIGLNTDGEFTVKHDVTEASLFTFRNVEIETLSAADLIFFEKTGFSMSIKGQATDGKWTVDLTDNFFSGHLTPMNFDGDKFVAATADNDNIFYLKNSNGKYVVAYSDLAAGFENAYQFVEVSSEDLRRDILKDGEQKYFGQYTFYYSTETIDKKKVKVIDHIEMFNHDEELQGELGRLDFKKVPYLAVEPATKTSIELLPIRITLGNDLIADWKKVLADKFFTVEDITANAKRGFKIANCGGAEWENGTKAGNELEKQWALTYDEDNAEYVFTNRENLESSFRLPGALYTTNADYTYNVTILEGYKIVDNVTTPVYKNVTLVIKPVEGTKSTDGYLVLPDVKNHKFHIGYWSGTFGDHAWFSENHADDHQIGLNMDEDVASVWTAIEHNKEYKEWEDPTTYVTKTQTADSIYVISHLGYINTDGKQDYKLDTLKVVSYSFVNEYGESLYWSNTYTAQVDGNDRYALREDNGHYNIRLGNIERADNQRYYIFSGCGRKTYAGDAADGILSNTDFYTRTENDLFDVVETEHAMYRRVINPLDTVSIFRDGNDKSVLFEQAGFLGMENLAQFPAIAPGMIADTAYVRYNTYRPQYMLVVGAKITKPSEDLCEICGKPECEHSKSTTGSVEGRFLVNLKDTAIAWANANLHNAANPYTNTEKFYRLGFVQATHRNDSLIIAKDGKKIFVGDENFNVAKFAFKYVDTQAKSFRIETADYRTLKEGNKAGELKKTTGWVKWMNGVVVVVDREQDGDIYNMDEEFEGQPTANEGIATSEVTVIAGEGQVTIAGAAGKKVVISNILGQVVANTVLASDNAVIAAPQGVVVVAVEGEEAVKAIVK